MNVARIGRLAFAALLAALPALVVFDVRAFADYALIPLGVR